MDVIINTGIAGSLDAEIDIGDIVISTDAVEHDMDASIFGDPIGQIPQMDTFSFPADESLVKLAKEVNEKANPDVHTWIGRVVSGDQLYLPGRRKSSLFGSLTQSVQKWRVRPSLMRPISTKFRASSFVPFRIKPTTVLLWTIRLSKRRQSGIVSG